MNPSAFSNIGVYENDFLIPRTPEEIRDIFDSVGYKLSDEEFKNIWVHASQQNPKGNVSLNEIISIQD